MRKKTFFNPTFLGSVADPYLTSTPLSKAAVTNFHLSIAKSSKDWIHFIIRSVADPGCFIPDPDP
jgi:hypothetical protein